MSVASPENFFASQLKQSSGYQYRIATLKKPGRFNPKF
jgi:hypothetical protein